MGYGRFQNSIFSSVDYNIQLDISIEVHNYTITLLCQYPNADQEIPTHMIHLAAQFHNFLVADRKS